MKKERQQSVVGSGQDKNSQIILYQTKDGQTKLDVRLEDETVWLSQDQMAELYGKSKSTINEHIKNVYEEHELAEEATLRKFGNSEFSTKPTNFYNLDMIISVGYRVKSIQGTQFRIWATQRIKEYIIKGFTLDDERLKQGGAKARYFQELLQRIRDIRSSERNFYQKVTDIYDMLAARIVALSSWLVVRGFSPVRFGKGRAKVLTLLS